MSCVLLLASDFSKVPQLQVCLARLENDAERPRQEQLS